MLAQAGARGGGGGGADRGNYIQVTDEEKSALDRVWLTMS